MSSDGKSNLPEILAKHEADLLADWIKEQWPTAVTAWAR